jgi:hypothetical protein
MSRDIKALMAIYTILILVGWNIGLKYDVEKEKVKKLEAMQVAINLNEVNDDYIVMLESMNRYADSLERDLEQNKLLKDFLSIDDNLKRLTLALCFTESNLNYEVKHKGKFDKTTVGICGLKTKYWIDEIEEINHQNINSLYAGSLVIEYLLNKYNGDLEKTLKHYKGADKNLEPVKRVIEIYEGIK